MEDNFSWHYYNNKVKHVTKMNVMLDILQKPHHDITTLTRNRDKTIFSVNMYTAII